MLDHSEELRLYSSMIRPIIRSRFRRSYCNDPQSHFGKFRDASRRVKLHRFLAPHSLVYSTNRRGHLGRRVNLFSNFHRCTGLRIDARSRD
jgi:hypothetical protein